MAKQLKERVQTGTDENGKPIYKWATGFTKQELLMNAAKLLCECGEVAPQEKPAASKHLFKEYAQNWFDVFKKPTVRPLTAQTYAQQLEKHLYPVFGEMFIEDITPAHIQTHLNNLQHLAQESQQKQINVLRMVFDMAIEDGFITHNPVKSKKVHLTNHTRKEREPLERDEMLATIAKIPQVTSITERCFIAIQALHAMRPCEVLGLKWEDVDLERGIIRIRRNVTHPTRNLAVVGDTKTLLSKRDIAISQIARPYIEDAAARSVSRHHFLFGGAQPLSYTQHRTLMRHISKQMGMQGITGYTFRHTIITDVYEETHDANIAAAVAGHSKTTITMNRYAHARRDSAVKGIKALDEAYHEPLCPREARFGGQGHQGAG